MFTVRSTVKVSITGCPLERNKIPQTAKSHQTADRQLKKHFSFWFFQMKVAKMCRFKLLDFIHFLCHM